MLAAVSAGVSPCAGRGPSSPSPLQRVLEIVRPAADVGRLVLFTFTAPPGQACVAGVAGPRPAPAPFRRCHCRPRHRSAAVNAQARRPSGSAAPGDPPALVLAPLLRFRHNALPWSKVRERRLRRAPSPTGRRNPAVRGVRRQVEAQGIRTCRSPCASGETPAAGFQGAVAAGPDAAPVAIVADATPCPYLARRAAPFHPFALETPRCRIAPLAM